MSTHDNTGETRSMVIDRAREFAGALERRRKDIAYEGKLLAKLRRIQAGERASDEELLGVWCLLKELDRAECVERYGENALTATYLAGRVDVEHKSLCEQVDDHLCILREEENDRVASLAQGKAIRSERGEGLQADRAAMPTNSQGSPR